MSDASRENLKLQAQLPAAIARLKKKRPTDEDLIQVGGAVFALSMCAPKIFGELMKVARKVADDAERKLREQEWGS